MVPISSSQKSVQANNAPYEIMPELSTIRRVSKICPLCMTSMNTSINLPIKNELEENIQISVFTKVGVNGETEMH